MLLEPASIPRRNRWRRAPHAAPRHPGFRLGALQLRKAGERAPRIDPRQPVAHQGRIDEQTVFKQDVREMPVVQVPRFPFELEPYPAAEDERRQPLARFTPERCRSLEPAPDLRRINAKEPHASETRDIDCVSVEHRTHENRIGARDFEAGRHRLHGGNSNDG